MTIRELYEKYHVMPQLVTHMLRVGAVGKIIAENWVSECDIKFTTDLCLIHDMGNIVKFDLSENENNKLFGPIKNIETWREIQKSYWDKYGHDAHDATVGILNDSGLDRFVDCITEEEKLYFAEASESELDATNVATIIMLYSDCKVTPAGVVSYRERIDDLSERYGGGRTKTWYDWTYRFEKWMQSKTKIDLQSIDEAMVEPLFDELLGYDI